jgi:hypothetical protein
VKKKEERNVFATISQSVVEKVKFKRVEKSSSSLITPGIFKNFHPAG